MRRFKFHAAILVLACSPIDLAAMSSRTILLSDMVRSAEDLKKFLHEQKPLPVENFTATPPPVPPLQLPSTDSVLSNFRSSLPAEVLDSCASFLRCSAEAARRSYERAYHALYSSARPTQDEVHKLRHICEQIYHRTSVSSAQHCMTSARQRVAKLYPETEDYAEPKPQIRFRQEYVPFLEQYFRSNAYPSNVERARLARETKMSDRQIEVWFQNHRNRARREGKVLRRPNIRSCGLGPVVENHVPSDSSGYEFESSSSCSDQEMPSKLDMSTQPCAPSKTIFGAEIPPYAFPTRYSEGRGMTKVEHLEFSADLWMRKPASAAPAALESTQIDELIVQFSKQMTIQDTTSVRRVKRPFRGSSRRSTNPWYTATTTFAPRAPYFALVKPQEKHVRVSVESNPLPKHTPTPYSSRSTIKATGPLPQNRSRLRLPSPSSGSADESSSNEPITPPSSPPACAFPSKVLPDWFAILNSVTA